MPYHEHHHHHPKQQQLLSQIVIVMLVLYYIAMLRNWDVFMTTIILTKLYPVIVASSAIL